MICALIVCSIILMTVSANPVRMLTVLTVQALKPVFSAQFIERVDPVYR